MAAINFPSSPSNGDTHVVDGVTYTYNSAETKWKTTINSNAFLPLSGGTVSGNLSVSGDVTVDTDTLYVDSTNNRVGVGVTSPSKALHVDSASFDAALFRRANASGGAGIFLSNNSENGAFVTSEGGAGGGFAVYTQGSGVITQRLSTDSSGNLKFNSGYGSVATAYGVRAWVNFNGRNTLSIYDDGGISSITDNGTGDYTVNFDFTMPDINYAFTGSASYVAAASSAIHTVELRGNTARSTSKTTTAIRHDVVYSDGSQNRTRFDYDEISIVYFR